MGEREVKSPWSSTGNEARRGYSPGAYSNPSNGKARADGGHIAHNLGKGGHRPVSARRDCNTPVQGGQRSPYDPRD
jgi:hypothetical protein